MNEDAIPNEEITRMVHSMMPFAGSLGLEFFEASATRVVARAGWTSHCCTANGQLHGGFLMAAADSVGGACAWLNLPQGSKTATIESKTNFFRPVKQGSIEVVATPVHIGRTTIVVQTDITREKGKLVSRTIQTQAVIF
jgi:1,4-dihydroxy-2-naphthoyl-CoA hydrolase